MLENVPLFFTLSNTPYKALLLSAYVGLTGYHNTGNRHIMKFLFDFLVGGRLERRKRDVGVSYCSEFTVPTSPFCGRRWGVPHSSSPWQIPGLFFYLHL